jgi:hypothetical protein
MRVLAKLDISGPKNRFLRTSLSQNSELDLFHHYSHLLRQRSANEILPVGEAMKVVRLRLNFIPSGTKALAFSKPWWCTVNAQSERIILG